MFIFELVGSFLPEKLKHLYETYSWRFLCLKLSVCLKNSISSSNKKRKANIWCDFSYISKVFSQSLKMPSFSKESHSPTAHICVDLRFSSGCSFQDENKENANFWGQCSVTRRASVGLGWKWTRELCDILKVKCKYSLQKNTPGMSSDFWDPHEEKSWILCYGGEEWLELLMFSLLITTSLLQKKFQYSSRKLKYRFAKRCSGF